MNKQELRRRLSATVFVLPATLFASEATADPPILPPPPDVVCFAKTGADQINGGDGIRIQFEILNWTPEPAFGLKLTAVNFPPVSTGIDPIVPGGDMFGAPTPAPLFGPFINKANTNSWAVSQSSTTMVTWASPANDPLANIDLPLVPPFPPLPDPINSGPNTLDGFILDLPWLGVNERVVFGWELLDRQMARITDPDGYSFGAFQIDRAPNGPGGQVRQRDFVAIGIDPLDFFGPDDPVPELDPEQTDQMARTDPAVGSNVVPLPASFWMMASVLLGGFLLRRRPS